MPEYKKDVQRLLEAAEVQACMNTCTNPEGFRDKALIAMLYLTGARSMELCHRFKRCNADFTINEGFVRFAIYTGKLRKQRPPRLIDIPLSAPFMDYLVSYIQSISNMEEELWPISTTRVKQIIYRASRGTLCPYNFRHSRLYSLSQHGASVDQLKNWKGAADIRSINQYLDRKPIGRDLRIV